MSAPDPGSEETRAVVARYARRAPRNLYSPLRPEVWQGLQERQRAMLRGFAARGCSDLAALHLTEVGCGGGGNLLELLRLGATAAQLTGLELLPERLAAARESLPAATTLWLGDATRAPVPQGSQDIVLQPFSSIWPMRCGRG
jgi:SAM-dependent methyltransferase